MAELIHVRTVAALRVLREQGCVIVEDVLRRDEIRALSDAVTELERGIRSAATRSRASAHIGCTA